MTGYDRPARVVDRDDDHGTAELLSEIILGAYTNHTWIEACGLKLYHRAHDGRNVVEVFPPESGYSNRLEIVNCSAFTTVSELRDTLESIRANELETEN